jgi:hypothetical protein
MTTKTFALLVTVNVVAVISFLIVSSHNHHLSSHLISSDSYPLRRCFDNSIDMYIINNTLTRLAHLLTQIHTHSFLFCVASSFFFLLPFFAISPSAVSMCCTLIVDVLDKLEEEEEGWRRLHLLSVISVRF